MIEEVPQGDEESLADDIFVSEVYEASKPLKKNFFAWHRPRKQFVRHYQWCEQLNNLLDSVAADGRTLKYLGLPGDDLLDLRYFHDQVCVNKNVILKFLGFNKGANSGSDAQTELNISLDEVRRLEKVDPSSDVIADDFCGVADIRSMAWKQAKAYGPYDVINIDLCNGFALHKPDKVKNTHYVAMGQLLALQSKRKEPWLLFLTTRTRREDVDEDALERLVKKYLENLAECPAFQAASDDVMSIPDETALRNAMDTSDGHLNVFLVGLSKWLIGLAVAQSPPSIVEVKSAIGYRVDPGSDHDDLVSIALRFDPTFEPPADAVGLLGAQDTEANECVLATKAVKRLRTEKRVNADDALAGNHKLYDEMCESTADLLELARYDRSAYYAWLAAD